MPPEEGCRRADLGKTSRTVRGGRGWKPGYGGSIGALSHGNEEQRAAPPKSQAPSPDPTTRLALRFAPASEACC